VNLYTCSTETNICKRRRTTTRTYLKGYTKQQILPDHRTQGPGLNSVGVKCFPLEISPHSRGISIKFMNFFPNQEDYFLLGCDAVQSVYIIPTSQQDLRFSDHITMRYLSTMKMETAGSCETSVHFYQTTCHHVPSSYAPPWGPQISHSRISK
jgi:hypothetical protein